jgi:general secretion pathway protein I
MKGYSFRGFTLIEMLITVVIIGAVGTVIATAIGGVANQTFSLERKTVANWVASNHITQIRIKQRIQSQVFPEGKINTQVFMAQRQWEIETTTQATDHPWLRRLEVDVYEIGEGERRGPYDHSTAFIGRY